jgi:Flp pilus assembly protein TadG
MRWRKRWRSESGAELVEFALTFPLLLLVVLGIIDFGTMFQQYEVVTNAAREGARIAVLPNYTDPDVLTRVDQYVSQSIFTLGGGNLQRTVTRNAAVAVGGGACMSTVTVTVNYDHTYLFLGGIGTYFGRTFGTKTLSASSTMRTEIVSGACP